MPMRRNNMKNLVGRGAAFAWLPAAALMMGAMSLSPAHAFQVPATDAATKAAMEKRASARTLLSSALGRIAANGNNAAALLDAGKASMALDDYRAALGFLLRAEQNAPRDGAIKAALGTAMVHQENPQRALDYFGEAQLLRTPESLFVADRALAHDLLGQSEAAQRDYALALTHSSDDEVVRRYALSLGISGQPDRAVEYLTPLLNQQDRSAWRTRAMVLAMNGRQAEAKSIIDATLPPALAQSIWPYVEQMDRLTPAQQAAAAHFGRFPSGELGPKRVPAQMAAATPPAPAKASPVSERQSRAAARAAQPAVRANRQQQLAQQVATKPAAPAARTPTPSVRAQAVPAQQAAPVQMAAAPAAGPLFTSTSTILQSSATASTPPVSTPPAAAPAAAAAPRGPVGAADRGNGASAAAANGPRSRVEQVLQAQQRAAAGPVDMEARRAAPAAGPAIAPPNPTTSALVNAPPPPPPAAPLAAMASLSDIVGSLEIPAAEMQQSQNALSADVLARVREEGRRAEMAAAAKAREDAARARAEAAAKARADAAAKAKADAEAKVKAEAAAKAREEAEKRRANPSRIWVQIGSGSNQGALGFTFDRYAKKHKELFKGVKGGHSDWGRTRRLLAGPFANRAAAQKFLDGFKAAESDGFVFTSAVGEEVEIIK